MLLSFLTQYGQKILDQYEEYRPEFQALPIGFTGVASEPKGPIPSIPLDDDFLLTDLRVSFTNVDVLVAVSNSNGVFWQQDPFSIAALAANPDTVVPILPLQIEYLIKQQNKIFFTFTNAAASPVTGGYIYLRGIRLLKKKVA